MDNLAQIMITIGAIAGSTALWQFLSLRIKASQEKRKDELKNDDGMQYRDDLKNRVKNLESLLANASDEKDELRNQVLILTEEVASLRVEVNYLKKENERLKLK